MTAAPWSRTPLRPCGTHAAFQRHIRAGEQPDEACVEAEKAYKRDARSGLVTVKRRARDEALEALAHRHQEEFNRLYAAALAEQSP